MSHLSSEKRMREIVANVGTDLDPSSAFDDPDKIEKRTKFIREKLDEMTEEQQTRFEFFYRSHLNRGFLKESIAKIINERTEMECQVTDDIAIVVGSLTKLFVGDLVETAMKVKEDLGDKNEALKTHHISESFLRLQQAGKLSKQDDSYYLFSNRNRFITPSTIDELCSVDISEKLSTISTQNTPNK